MQKTTSSFCVFLSVVTSAFLFCNLPPDPTENPNYVYGTLFIPDNPQKISAQQGDTVQFRIAIYLPKHVIGYGINFVGFNKDSLHFSYTSASTVSWDTTNIIRYAFNCPGLYTIIGYVQSRNGFTVYDTMHLEITPPPFQITIDTILAPPAFQVNREDSILIKAHSIPASPIAFNAKINENRAFVTLRTNSDSTSIFIIKPDKAGIFEISITASIGKVTTSKVVPCTVLNVPSLQNTFVEMDTLEAGVSETLQFIASKDSLSSNTVLQFLNESDFPNDIIRYLSKKSDTIIFEFTPINPDIYTFVIAVSNRYFSDTIRVIREVSGKTVQVWKKVQEVITAVEGSEKQVNCTMLLNLLYTDVDRLSASKGIIQDGIWRWTVPWGIVHDTVMITAIKDTASFNCTLLLTATPGDSSKPVINVTTPDSITSTVSADAFNCQAIISDMGAGVGSVKIRQGDLWDIAMKQSDTLYNFTVKGLEANKKTPITIIAQDSSQKRNTDSLTIYLTYDPGKPDDLGPVITRISGPSSDTIIRKSPVSYTFTVTDNSGVDSLYCNLNNGPVIALTPAVKDTYTLSLPLTSFGANRCVIYAKDKAPSPNRDSLVLTFRYNRLPSVLLKSPANGAEAVPRKVLLSWSGQDADNDTLRYQVFSGFTESNLEQIASDIDSVYLFTAVSGKLYYWKIAVSDDNETFIESAVRSFKVNTIPTVTLSSPANTASGLNLPVSFAWSGNDTDAGETAGLLYTLYADTTQNFKTGISLQNALSYSMTNLLYGKTYYWKITATDTKDTGSSPVYSFSTGNPAKITLPPKDDTLKLPGGSASFTVAVNGYGKTVSYRWLRNATLLGDTTPTLTLTGGTHNDTYRCIVANGIGKPDTSTPAVLRIAYRITTANTGNGSGTISPSNPYVMHGNSRIFTITPADGSIVAKLFKGDTKITAAYACTLSTITAPDSVKVHFFTVPKLLKPIPSKGKTFLMGRASGAIDGDTAHQVTFTYGFYMDSTEVTQGDYSSLYNSPWIFFTNQGNIPLNTNNPATCFNWCDAVLYCNARSKRDGLDTAYRYIDRSGSGTFEDVSDLNGLQINYNVVGYRLPSEAEWEFAYRGGTTKDYYWGTDYYEDFSDSNLIRSYEWCLKRPMSEENLNLQMVGQKLSNPYKLCDMAGNAYEFTNDLIDILSPTPVTNPTGKQWQNNTVHIYEHTIRGGSVQNDKRGCAAWSRNSTGEGWGGVFLGFRCVLPVEPMGK
ncbi:MAG: SUMF1/EgtB/PvdO family nonheme iron enzyme [Chitinispirillaceae bacterium]|nr:SUMF1/EgtB/PvdO family nonheme iron enzyme [Chitinispirillaceae bacterium]